MENEKIEENSKPSVPVDCMSCRLTGGISLLLCSAYVFRISRIAKYPSTKYLSYIFGSSLGYTGAARLMQWFPFHQELKPEISS